MKLFLASAALLLSVVAQASPKVGDYSEFQLTVSQGAQSMVGSYIMAVISESGDSVVVTTTIHFDGQPDQFQQDQMKKTDLLSDQTISDVLTNCAAYGGSAEQLSTTNGPIATCKMAMQGQDPANPGQMWIGAVPFGIVKQIQSTPEGQTFTLDLKKFIVGK